MTCRPMDAMTIEPPDPPIYAIDAELGRDRGSGIRRDELKAFRKLAGEMLALDDKALAAAMRNGTIMEIECHG